MRVTVEMDWERHGAVRIIGEKLLFPQVGEKPGIYRFTLRWAEGQSVYIGEAERLRRRFAHYCNPGPSQSTNQRLNTAIRETIRASGNVDVETATQVRVDVQGHSAIADLALRPYRLLAENAALVIALQLGHIIENL
jgi:hypothetical protein